MYIYVTPIKPIFAYRIFTRRKKYDLRKMKTSYLDMKPGSRVVLYVTGGVKAFMGEYTIGRVITGTPDYILKILTGYSDTGIGEEDFKYIAGSRQAIAIEVVDPVIYRKPLSIKDALKIIPDYNPPLGIQRLDIYEPIVILLFNKARDQSASSRKKLYFPNP